jgi:hypothetical protein
MVNASRGDPRASYISSKMALACWNRWYLWLILFIILLLFWKTSTLCLAVSTRTNRE